MPLPPPDWIRSIESRCDRDRSNSGSPFTMVGSRHDWTCTAYLRRKHRHDNLNNEIEPLVGFGPSDIHLVLRRIDQIVRIIVDLVMELGVGRIDTFVHSKLIQMRSIRRIQTDTAIVFGVSIAVCDSSSAAVIVCEFYRSWNRSCPPVCSGYLDKESLCTTLVSLAPTRKEGLLSTIMSTTNSTLIAMLSPQRKNEANCQILF